MLESVSGIGEAYREPLLEIIRAYVRSVKIGNPDVGRMDSQKPLSVLIITVKGGNKGDYAGRVL